jgi:hypothetical protein
MRKMGLPMTTSSSIESREKLALIWAARRERLLAVRVYYDICVDGGGTIYALNSIQEIGSITPVS